MIDPKFNELPVQEEGDFADSPTLTEEQLRSAKPRAGLSINETVAADASLSVGSRGVDTSGTRSGAGAGAGMTYTGPGDSGSPAPNIAPDARGSGTTTRGDDGYEQMPTTRLNSATERDESSESPTTRLEAGSETGATHRSSELAARAYRCWHERGCPEGSPELDWQRAERELAEERQTRTFSAGSHS